MNHDRYSAEFRSKLLYILVGAGWFFIVKQAVAISVTDSAVPDLPYTVAGWIVAIAGGIVLFAAQRRQNLVRQDLTPLFAMAEQSHENQHSLPPVPLAQATTAPTGEPARQSETGVEMYRQLFEQSLDAMLLVTPAGAILQVNPAACRLFGMTAAEIIHAGRDGLMDQTDPRLPAALDACARLAQFRGELTFLRNASTLFQGELTANAFTAPDGRECVFMVIRDITERKRAERDLVSERDAKRPYIPDSAADGFITLDRKWIITYANPEAARINKKRAEDMIGKSYWDEWPGLAGGFVEQQYRKAMTERAAVHFEHQNIAAGEAHNWFDLHAYPTFEGLALYFRDVTARKHVERALHHSESYMRALFECSPIALYSIDLDGLVMLWNPSSERMLGWSAEEVVGKPLPIVPEGDSSEFAELRLQVTTGRTVSGVELIRRKKNGEAFHASLSAAPIYDAAHRIIGIIAALEDITDRKQAEAQLRELNTVLEQRVAERTAQLAALNNELQTFAYSVSHDLKAPLRGIDGYSRLLLEDYGDKLDEEGQAFLRTIRHATGQMAQLIEDLLAYSRLERRALVIGAVNPAALIQALLAERGPELRHRNVTITIDVPCDAVTAEADGLTQALRNLLDNALKFTQNVAAPQIEIGGRATAESCLIWVRDNGIGFDMQYHDRIFGIFQRLHRAEDYPGTGVGLAIVRKAMERMGGQVWAESAPGAGATFYLEIPRNGVTYDR